MCGLFGIVRVGADRLDEATLRRARRALHTLEHRGPDQWGEWVDGNVYLGHRRLSILDLSEEGRQPMVSHDGQVAITVNGEIYNYQDLKRDLTVRFRSGSDSEVVLHSYRAWGIDQLLERMDGMYALVVVDRARRRLFLARDRCGIKPLHLGRVGADLVWASELKAITAYAEAADLDVDPEALVDFLTYSYVPAPKTMYRQVQKLEPAHVAEINTDSGAVSRRRYWSLEPTSEPVDHEQAAERLREVLRRSVKEQLMSDVPVGFFLSGGIDSSIVVGSAVGAGVRPATFSIGFDDPAHDETHYAELVARHFGTDQKTEILSAHDASDLVDRLWQWYDEPFADSSALPTFWVSSHARKHSVVVLTGDGGDEVFGGYIWYQLFPWYRAVQTPLRWVWPRGARLAWARRTRGLMHSVAVRLDRLTRHDPLDLYATLMRQVIGRDKDRYRRAWGVADDYDEFWHFRRFWRPELGRRKSLQYLDFNTFLPDDILTKVDRVSMAVSLECRVPFLSRAVVELAFSLPEDFLYRDGQLKGGLKYAFRDLLPRPILERGKKGFSIPLVQWGATVLREHRSLQEAVLQAHGLLGPLPT
jgi:asparagine synthase (glutamine-hydrolysing)